MGHYSYDKGSRHTMAQLGERTEQKSKKTYLAIGASGKSSVQFSDIPLPTSTRYDPIQCRVFNSSTRSFPDSGLYLPSMENQATYDTFIYDKDAQRAITFQATVGEMHDAKTKGFEWLRSKGIKEIVYIAVGPDLVPSLRIEFKAEDDVKIKKKYFLEVTSDQVAEAYSPHTLI